MKYALLISAVVEILGGLVLYFAPHLVIESGSYLTKIYSISALTIGLICLYSFIYYENNKLIKATYLVLMFFHAAIGMMTYGDRSDAINNPQAAVIVHIGVFVILLLGYLKDIKPDSPN